MGGWYSSFREYGGPTLYGPMKTPVTADVLEAGFLYAIVITAVSFIILIPAFRERERIFYLIKFVLGLFILGSIMLCNFGQEWEVAEIHTKTQYRAGLRKEIDASIGVKIGLRSVNITLKTDPVVQNFGLENETINYNERFAWNNLGWTQGRFGFGPFSGEVNQEFRAAQFKGLPYPILWVAEYFTIDGEGIRWGRFYRQAGYYTHILIWFAFPLWILTLVLFKMVLHYGAYFSMMTGCVLLIGNILYATIRNPLDLQIPFEDAHLTFHWGWCFWLNLINGLLCLLLGCTVWFMELRFREAVYSFFSIDIALDIEEYYATTDELKEMGVVIDPQDKKAASTRHFKRNTPVTASGGSGEYDNKKEREYKRLFRPRHDTRGTIASRIMTLSGTTNRRTRTPLSSIQTNDDQFYENHAFAERIDEDDQNGFPGHRQQIQSVIQSSNFQSASDKLPRRRLVANKIAGGGDDSPAISRSLLGYTPRDAHRWYQERTYDSDIDVHRSASGQPRTGPSHRTVSLDSLLGQCRPVYSVNDMGPPRPAPAHAATHMRLNYHELWSERSPGFRPEGSPRVRSGNRWAPSPSSGRRPVSEVLSRESSSQ